MQQGVCISCGTAVANTTSQTCQCPTGQIFVYTGCVAIAPPTCGIVYTGNVCTSYRLLQGITVTNLPSYFVTNPTACNDLLQVSCSTPNINPNITIEYQTNSIGNFIVQISVIQATTIPITISCSFNPKYKAYFSSGDLAQVVTQTINPASYNVVSDCVGCGISTTSTTTSSTTTTTTSGAIKISALTTNSPTTFASAIASSISTKSGDIQTDPKW